MIRPVRTSKLHQRSNPPKSCSHRDAEFGRQFHSFGFRYLHGDLLQEVEPLICKGVNPLGNRGVDVVLAPHIGQIESNLSELVDFALCKAC